MGDNISPQTLLPPKDAARVLGTTVSTMSSWRVLGKQEPRWVKIGKLVKYQYADLLAFIEKQKQGGNSDAAA